MVASEFGEIIITATDDSMPVYKYGSAASAAYQGSSTSSSAYQDYEVEQIGHSNSSD